MNLFETVKANVTVKQAAERYGIRVEKNGMVLCPFHPDHHPSMKVDRRFHCFGCQADGDVIDFTARLYGLSNYEAAKKLAEDFSIDYDTDSKNERKLFEKSGAKRRRSGHGPPGKGLVRYGGGSDNCSQSTPLSRVQKSPEEIFAEAEQKCFRIYADYLHLLEKWKELYAPQMPEEEWHLLFCEALEQISYTEYLLDTLLYGTLADRMHLICEKGKEVETLERRLERYAERITGESSGGGTGSDNSIAVCDAASDTAAAESETGTGTAAGHTAGVRTIALAG